MLPRERYHLLFRAKFDLIISVESLMHGWNFILHQNWSVQLYCRCLFHDLKLSTIMINWHCKLFHSILNDWYLCWKRRRRTTLRSKEKRTNVFTSPAHRRRYRIIKKIISLRFGHTWAAIICSYSYSQYKRYAKMHTPTIFLQIFAEVASLRNHFQGANGKFSAIIFAQLLVFPNWVSFVKFVLIVADVLILK